MKILDRLEDLISRNSHDGVDLLNRYTEFSEINEFIRLDGQEMLVSGMYDFWGGNRDIKLVLEKIESFRDRFTDERIRLLEDRAVRKITDLLSLESVNKPQIYYGFLNDDFGGIGIKNVLINVDWMMKMGDEEIVGLISHEINHTLMYSDIVAFHKTKGHWSFVLHNMIVSEGISCLLFSFDGVELYEDWEIKNILEKYNLKDDDDCMKFFRDEIWIHKFSLSVMAKIVKFRGNQILKEIMSRPESAVDVYLECV